MTFKLRPVIAFFIITALALPLHAADESRVDKLEKDLAELRAAVAEARGLEDLEERIDILTREIERLRLGAAATEETGVSGAGLGPAASKIYGRKSGVSIGGYGEMLFEGYDSTREDGERSGKIDKADALRAIIYFGYKFDDRFVFNSELEVEHGIAADGASGEVALEFAYLDWLHSDSFNLRGGLLLVPMGFVNELHEPPVFHGARRPDVERNLIPATWRELGFGAHGDFGPFSYRAWLVNGLDSSGYSSSGIRGGRQKGSKAKAETFALTGRLDYTGMPGLLVGGSFFAGNSDQGDRTADGFGFEGRTTVWDLHAEWRGNGFDVRGLYVSTEIEDAAAINSANGLTGNGSVGSEQSGWYLQAGWDVLSLREGSQAALTPFVRFEEFNTQEEVPTGFSSNPARDVEILTIGVDFKPIDRIVLKAEFQQVENGARTGVDQWNVALGYLF